jgi:hypothetical protein
MAYPRPRPQVISLTDAAAERIKYVIANAVEPVVGVPRREDQKRNRQAGFV